MKHPRKAPAPILPRFLPPGGTIGIIAPSGVVDRARLRAGCSYLEARGYRLSVAPHVFERTGYLAGNDASRAADLNAATHDESLAAIFLARGGYGLTRILNRVDIGALRRRKPLLLGYSDATALFMALQRQGPYGVLYGPMVSEMGESSSFDEKSLWAGLRGDWAGSGLAFANNDVLRPGRGAGRVIGGCLSLLVSLLGTPYDPDYRGAILFWEEIGEEPYRIDRMLTQLRNAGKFEGLRGMLIGSVTGCDPAPGKASLRLREIVADATSRTRFPIIRNVRAGHIARKITLPLGFVATLDTTAGGLIYRRVPGSTSKRAPRKTVEPESRSVARSSRR